VFDPRLLGEQGIPAAERVSPNRVTDPLDAFGEVSVESVSIRLTRLAPMAWTPKPQAITARKKFITGPSEIW
jgi:hypothetical protein